ncbi:hypothetical protein NSQ62_07870 [Solibacillus sp. FSL H8-0523]|uniref:hypothetical protein n=1 Tax=Solibacillus sp. FSL H8-0523 TaxID=2954511 RepID=UPI00310112A5
MLTRYERRKEARKNKQTFAPQYSGPQPKTFEEFYGVGYERFNNKFVTIKETEEIKMTEQKEITK